MPNKLWLGGLNISVSVGNMIMPIKHISIYHIYLSMETTRKCRLLFFALVLFIAHVMVNKLVIRYK